MSEYLNDLGKAIPPDKRTARAMVYLLEATKRARQDVAERASAFKTDNNETLKIKREIYKELRRLKDRLDVYGQILATAPPDGPIPDEVKPLFYKFPKPPTAHDEQLGRDYWVPTPDAYTPRMIASMLSALQEHDKSMEDLFWKYLWEEVKKLPTKAGEFIHDVVSDAADAAFPRWPLAVGGVLVVGTVVMVARGRK
jgi:hypothetical protein